MKKIITVGCILIVLISGFIYARRTSPLFNLLFQPSDKYVPLAVKEVDLSKQGLKIQLPFKTKYPGSHQLDLEVERIDFGTPFKGHFLLDVCVKNKKNEPVISKKVAGPSSSFWGPQKKGFLLQSFVVPDQIGRGENGIVEVTITIPDANFANIYGSAKLAVNKGSDE